MLLVLAVALSLPIVQTKLGEYVTQMINKDYGTDIHVDQVAISAFGGVKLKTVRIRDDHKNTLIYANRIKTNVLSFSQLYNGDLYFGDIRLDGAIFHIRKYKGEEDTNFDRFIALFDSNTPSKKKFLMQAKNVYISNGRFIVSDDNSEVSKDVDFSKLNASLHNFKILGPDISATINGMSFLDHRGLEVKSLDADFVYTKTKISLANLDLVTANSFLKGDVLLTYIKEDFTDFTNKVKFDIAVNAASLATNDIYYFYKELGRDNHFAFSSHITGTLNNLKANNMRLVDDNNSQIIGDVHFKNLFNIEGDGFYMNGNFQRVSSDYHTLVKLLPNVLGKKLPTSLSKIGNFNLSGTAEITTSTIDADVNMETSLGRIWSKLKMSNIDNIDNASYKGDIILDNFNIGRFLEKKDLGIVSLNVSVDGKGFTEKNLNTAFSGDIYKIRYQDYTYTKIKVNGNFKNPIFEGNLLVNDPNLFMDFDGIVNLGKKEIEYDFHTIIDYANLGKMNLVKNDSVSVFKGEIRVNVTGNTLDDLQGDIYINRTSYQNKNDTYYFDDFNVSSRFDADRIRTITVNSPDILEGQVVGKFEFGELRKMVENSLGSLYANYSPNKIKPKQFLKFNFSIYNKIIEIFYPGIEIAANTNVRGNINSDDGEFKFNFSSPQITAFENYFDKVNVQIDNKNPLYNAFIEIDSVRTKYYKVSDFSLINVTLNDTLFVRSEFKGGNKAADYFNINLYHTIDENSRSVVGIDKSEMQFKDFMWYLNENEQPDNRVVFDKSLKNFSIENIMMTHEDQAIALNGTLRGKSNKNLQLTFNNVDLNKITPEIPQFNFHGILNGEVSVMQNNDAYRPTSSIKIDSLMVNDIALGDLNVDIRGDENFSKFNVNSVLDNKNVESFKAVGDFSIANGQTSMDIDLRFQDFNLGLLDALLGGDAISNIKGFVSGAASVSGNVTNPEINGRLFVDDAALTIPYLNVEYKIDSKSIVDLTTNQFIIRNTGITDTKYQTQGSLVGRIRHNKFSDWELDININTSRLLALDTKDSEDAAYYGTAFINGSATISGPTTGLFIKVNATSEAGTAIKIPISNTEAVGTNGYIHFLSPSEKYNMEHGIAEVSRNYQGLELEFDLDITPQAEVEVILDRSSGHGIKGKGFGSLLFKINTLGKFNMWGDFQAYEGTYNFKYGGIIDKKFNVKKGGSIIWEGDPMRAILNLEAVYTTTANPAVLLENPSVNKKVPVEVIIAVKGSLTAPEPDFDINFPTVTSVLKSEIQYKLDDRDTRQTQALYLLSSGGFLSSEGVNQSDFAGNLFERASGIFSDIFQDEDGKFNVGLDYVSADKRPGTEADGRFGFTVSTQINERISINGKVGVPVGGINESAIVGDVEVQYRVNEDGTMNLRVFNRENDINYIGQGVGYTQGIGINYEVDFDTFKELINKIFQNAQLSRESESQYLIPDSSISPEYINFLEKKNKKKPEKVKPNREAIPEEY